MSERLAVLEFGSNAARFVVARITPGTGYRLIRDERVQTRLGAGPPAQLRATALRATVGAARRFLGSLGRDKPHRVLAVATAAVRDAANGHRLFDALSRVAEVDVEVLSGDEEARLGAEAARASLPVRDALVLDLGGGSMQLTRVAETRIEPLLSVPVGAVRLTRTFLRHDPPRPGELRALRQEVRAALAPHRLHTHGDVPLIGLGGTVRALARMQLAVAPGRRHTIHGLTLTREQVAARGAALALLPVARRRRVPGLKADRADIVVAGILALEEAMDATGHGAVTACERGVRHGVLLREAFRGSRA